MNDADVDLVARWRPCCASLAGGESAQGDVLWHVVCALHEWPRRVYHTLEHVAAVLRVLDEFAGEAERLREVEFALFLHDAVYVPGRGDNEARSAAVSGMMLRELGCGADVVERVARLIMATAHREEALAGDEALIADVDMAVLGAPAEEYDRYAAAIAEEFSFAGAQRYWAGRRAFLEGVVKRGRVFVTEAVGGRYEARARENVARELGRLR